MQIDQGPDEIEHQSRMLAAYDPVTFLQEDPLAAIESRHAGHRQVLGRGLISDDVYTLNRVLEADATRTDPARWPEHWEEVVSHTGQELADQGHSYAVKSREDSQNMYLTSIRENLSQKLAAEENQAILDNYLDDPSTALPEIFHNWRDETDTTWSEWFSEVASDEQLHNFLQWHNYHMIEMGQDPEIQRRITEQKQLYKEALSDAVEVGILPQKSKDSLDRLDTIQVRIGDVFDTLMEDRGGYHFRSTNFVVVDEQHIEFAVMHELNHAYLGELPFVWLDEALTEHIAQSFKKGVYGRFDANGEKQGAYPVERDFVDALAFMIVADDGERTFESKEEVVFDLIKAYAGDYPSLERIDTVLTRIINAKIDGELEDSGSFIALDEVIEYRYQANLADGMSNRIAMAYALQSVRSDLYQQPQVLFANHVLQAA